MKTRSQESGVVATVGILVAMIIAFAIINAIVTIAGAPFISDVLAFLIPVGGGAVYSNTGKPQPWRRSALESGRAIAAIAFVGSGLFFVFGFTLIAILIGDFRIFIFSVGGAVTVRIILTIIVFLLIYAAIAGALGAVGGAWASATRKSAPSSDSSSDNSGEPGETIQTDRPVTTRKAQTPNVDPWA